jgi:hypothetical protein
MTRVTFMTTTLAIALAGTLSTTSSAQIDTRDRTFMTFSGPAEMPGVTLQAGTYVFKLADTASRNVVQVWDREEKNIIGQWLFVPAERPEASQDTVVMFRETAAGRTPSVQYWYYPGERIGKEFVYPKDQAVQIAQRTQQRVLSTDGEISPNSTVNSVDATGKVTEYKSAQAQPSGSASEAAVTSPSSQAAVTSPSPTPAPPASAPAQAAAPRAPSAPATPPVPPPAQSNAERIDDNVNPPRQIARADTLPETASPLALIGLVGLLSLAGGATMRFVRRSRG